MATVAGLTLEWTAPISPAQSGPNYKRPPTPVVGGGKVFLISGGYLMAFDEKGIAGCSSAAVPSCRSIWAARVGSLEPLSPALVGGQVITLSTVYADSQTGTRLQAFDAAGIQNCGPNQYGDTMCDPVWSSPPMDDVISPPVVANGFIYADDSEARVAAWDATGQTNCSGTPKICEPVWRTTSLAGAGGGNLGLFSVSSSTLLAAPFFGPAPTYAFDPLGQTNCTGTPRICAPIWQSAALGAWPNGQGTLSGDLAYVPLRTSTGDALQVLPTGVAACPPAPDSCNPSWTGRLTNPANPTGPPLEQARMGATAVADGLVYLPAARPYESGFTVALSANGTTNCSGAPLRCEPIFYTDRYSLTPTIANGVLFAGGAAYDADGVTNCSGSPTICTPLWVGSTPSRLGMGATVVAGGRVFQSDEHTLSVYRLP